MTLIDTHTHLYDDQFDTDRAERINEAIAKGVTKMYMPNCDSTTIPGMMQVVADFPNNCYPMMGLHPCYVKDNYKAELDIVAQQLAAHKFWAVGEIGLDYYWDMTWKQQQVEAFEQQVDWALEYDLPIVIHSRESLHDCIDMVRRKQNGLLRGIFHCFSGNADEARQVTELGLYLGIGGVVTFKKSTLPEVLAAVDMQHIVLETDAPYLAPMPYRGKRNESAYIPLIAAKLAETKQMTIEEVAAITTANAYKIFGK